MRRWWKALGRTEQIAVAGLAVTLLVGILGALPAYLNWIRDPTSPPRKQVPFQVSAFEVRQVREIKADVIDANEVKIPDKMKAAVIDLTVRNTGTMTTIVTGTEFRVKVAERIDSCKPEGGPLRISGHYTVTLPDPIPRAPFSIKHSIRHEIKPNAADRFALSLGPKVWPIDAPSLLLYQVDVLIHHDDPSTGPVFAGTALLSSPIYLGERYGEGQYREFFDLLPASHEWNELFHYNDCIKKNREKVNRFFQLAGHRSPTIDAIEADTKK